MNRRVLIPPIVLFLLFSCKQKSNAPFSALINDINLKRGPVISCGPADQQYGSAMFETSCGSKEDFNLAVKMLHSFEYDEAEKMFAKVIDQQPECVLAYWGVAMCNFHPLWAQPTEKELKKGAKAIRIARSLRSSEREAAYIDAIDSFYTDWEKLDHNTRCLRFEKEMGELYARYPTDKEAGIFYALALNAAADLRDKTFSRQKKASAILTALYPGQPDHPGIVHYLIHTHDHPELAQLGLDAARKYASIAPSSAHALHMPSHIFTRLGLWDESIRSNTAAAAAAKCYAEASGIKGYLDEELHSLDYLVYGYLQKGDNDSAKIQVDYLKAMQWTEPANFKVAYAFASIPSRYLLENRLWKEATQLEFTSKNISWKHYPWQAAIVHFARSLGAVHTGDLPLANRELKQLNRLHGVLLREKDGYKANQVAIQLKAVKAWVSYKEGKQQEALQLMQLAADMEDKTAKHPVTPGEVLPARELLGDLLMEMNLPQQALEAYEKELQKNPNRLNALYGAGLAAERSGNDEKAKKYYQQLVLVAPASTRVEVSKGREYMKRMPVDSSLKKS